MGTCMNCGINFTFIFQKFLQGKQTFCKQSLVHQSLQHGLCVAELMLTQANRSPSTFPFFHKIMTGELTGLAFLYFASELWVKRSHHTPSSMKLWSLERDHRYRKRCTQHTSIHRCTKHTSTLFHFSFMFTLSVPWESHCSLGVRSPAGRHLGGTNKSISHCTTNKNNISLPFGAIKKSYCTQTHTCSLSLSPRPDIPVFSSWRILRGAFRCSSHWAHKPIPESNKKKVHSNLTKGFGFGLQQKKS